MATTPKAAQVFSDHAVNVVHNDPAVRAALNNLLAARDLHMSAAETAYGETSDSYPASIRAEIAAEVALIRAVLTVAVK